MSVYLELFSFIESGQSLEEGPVTMTNLNGNEIRMLIFLTPC